MTVRGRTSVGIVGRVGDNVRELWRCPRCGRRFVTPRSWHSCEVHTVEEHLAGVPPDVREVYLGYERLARSCGDDVEVVAQRTRIVFMVRVRYAGAVVGKRAVQARFALRRALDSPRVHRVEHHADRWIDHHVRLTSLDELDDELRGWLCESAMLGRQQGERRPAGQ